MKTKEKIIYDDSIKNLKFLFIKALNEREGANYNESI